MNETDRKGRLVYFSHGGGPLPILGDPGHASMVAFMERLPGFLIRPDAVLVISAHWEESVPTIIRSDAPELFYDYYGFPDEAYTLRYQAPGNSRIAGIVESSLSKSGIDCRQDEGRGLDHGVFIPMKLMYPDAYIPVTQLSLVKGLDPAAHLALGEALAGLLNENILILGSGFSFHNMRRFAWNAGQEKADPENDAFQEWLIGACTGDGTPEERMNTLLEWETAPSARYCHPREEHLLPLHVCLGAAGGSKGRVVFDDFILGKRAVAFLW